VPFDVMKEFKVEVCAFLVGMRAYQRHELSLAG
jgi:hypothetical protein